MNDLKFTTAQDYMHPSGFDDLMYQAGLTASGCWDEMDEYDQKAIMMFAKLIVKDCLDFLEAGAANEADDSEVQAALLSCALDILEHFDIELDDEE